MTLGCCEEVSRRGHLEPCDRPAVAYHGGHDGYHPYPVCGTHTTARGMVPIEEVIRHFVGVDEGGHE